MRAEAIKSSTLISPNSTALSKLTTMMATNNQTIPPPPEPEPTSQEMSSRDSLDERKFYKTRRHASGRSKIDQDYLDMLQETKGLSLDKRRESDGGTLSSPLFSSSSISHSGTSIYSDSTPKSQNSFTLFQKALGNDKSALFDDDDSFSEEFLVDETIEDPRDKQRTMFVYDESEYKMTSTFDPNLDMLRSTSIFNERPDVLTLLKPHFSFKVAEPNQILQKEGQLVSHIYWILTGTMAVRQCAKLVRVGQESIQNSMMRPFALDYTLKPNESIVTVSIDTQQLIVGDWFPYFPSLDENSTKQSLTDAIKTRNCDCSVIATSRTLVASVPIEAFLSTISLPIIHLLNRNCIFRWEIAELLEQYQTAKS